MNNRIFMCIDLKSFYASCECVTLLKDPLDEFLVVADMSRTEKTICLAVSPALKSFGIPGRARLFEVISRVKEINKERLFKISDHNFKGETTSLKESILHPEYAINFHAATPRMSHYIKTSTKIYEIYLKYFSKDDIHVYSIDEIFADITDYLFALKLSPYELTKRIIKDILAETGITATAGIGTNMYLAKVAMDIVAKHINPDDGIRIAYLDEIEYRKKLWNHTPLTDFWRVGAGISKRLNMLGIETMGDIARASLANDDCYLNERLLFKEFGKNAELIIDHAWGYEPTLISDVKNYKPKNQSISTGQVLHCGYDFNKGLLVAKEMLEGLCLELTSKRILTRNISLYIGYDIDNIDDSFNGDIELDHYGRKAPKASHGGIDLGDYTSSFKEILPAFEILYYRVVDEKLLLRRINIIASDLIGEDDKIRKTVQLDLFTDYQEEEKKKEALRNKRARDLNNQRTINDIKTKYGKNSILKGMNLEEGATTIERNKQIGGHKA